MERHLRADARLNQDKILEAAATLLGQPGADTSLRAIAQSAGVGIGTLYRRFPTREALIEAAYRRETEKLAQTAPALLKDEEARAALRAWMTLFLTYMTTKTGMADALPAILASRDGLKSESRDLLRSAVDDLLVAGQADRTLRADVDANDVLMSLGGIAMITAYEEDDSIGQRLADLLMEAIVTPAGAQEASADPGPGRTGRPTKRTARETTPSTGTSGGAARSTAASES